MDSRPCNLVLVGFMGSGKTTIGRRLAEDLDFGFIDLDEEIERTANCSISEIFANEGEQKFREYEHQILLRCQGVNKQIISTGGGIIERAENRALLRKTGFVIWLIANLRETLERTAHSNNRPLLKVENMKEVVRCLIRTRYPLYEEVADLHIYTNNLSPKETVCGIVDSANVFFATNCRN